MQPIAVVDAFTDRAFAGNPAGVCILPGPVDEGWMRSVARELNLSETAFLHAEGEGYRLRWLTPRVEVDLCGHATLASAHLLWEEGRIGRDRPALFETRSGRLTATLTNDGIALDFPAKPSEPVTPPEGLAEALGCPIVFVGRNAFDYLVETDSAESVRSLRPDYARLATLPVRGIIVTARSDEADSDFVSRFFAPAAGVNEDPVTGSAHCALGPFWGPRLGLQDMVGHQVSERGGRVGVRLRGDRVLLIGRAVTVWKGAFAANPP
ncbi:MAG: PhzF family phenazine biosynthesis protein [Isosphaeraceae bacterium]